MRCILYITVILLLFKLTGYLTISWKFFLIPALVAILAVSILIALVILIAMFAKSHNDNNKNSNDSNFVIHKHE